jgi:Phosphodiester glycosidase
MTHRNHRPGFPHLFSHVAAIRVKNRRLRSPIMVGIALFLLIFTLQGGQTEAIDGLFTPSAGMDIAAGQPYSVAYLQALRATERLHELAWLRDMPPKVQVHGASSRIVVADGVTLSTEVLQTVAGPEQISILTIDLTRPTLHLGVVQAYNRLISPDETLTSMANRSGAVAGINGDFFEIHGSGVPLGEELINGQLLHSPNPHFYTVVGVTLSGRITIGPESLLGDVIDGASSYPLFSINHYSEFNNGRLLLFTPALGEPVYVGGDPVAILRPVAGSAVEFTVQAVYPGVGWLPALKGQDALVGSGSAGYWLATTLHRRERIRLTDQIYPDDQLIQAIGGGPQLVKDGAFYFDPHSPAPGDWYKRNPQTAVGVTKDGTHALFAVFDGRLAGPRKSRGMTPAEVANFMIAHGAYNALLFDSGGSSEMVARLPGQHAVSIINWPSGGHERPVANGLFIYSTDATHAMAALRNCQLRYVASACTSFLPPG